MINAQRTIIFSSDIAAYELQINNKIFNLDLTLTGTSVYSDAFDALKIEIAKAFLDTSQPLNGTEPYIDVTAYTDDKYNVTVALTAMNPGLVFNVRVKATKCPRIWVHNPEVPTLNLLAKNEFTVALYSDKPLPEHYAETYATYENGMVNVDYTVYDIFNNPINTVKSYSIDEFITLIKRGTNKNGWYPFKVSLFLKRLGVTDSTAQSYYHCYFDNEKEKITLTYKTQGDMGIMGLTRYKPSEKIHIFTYTQLAQFIMDANNSSDGYIPYLIMPHYKICPFPQEFYFSVPEPPYDTGCITAFTCYWIASLTPFLIDTGSGFVEAPLSSENYYGGELSGRITKIKPLSGDTFGSLEIITQKVLSWGGCKFDASQPYHPDAELNVFLKDETSTSPDIALRLTGVDYSEAGEPTIINGFFITE